MRMAYALIGLALAALWCSAQDNAYQRGLADRGKPAQHSELPGAPLSYRATRQLAVLYGDTLGVTVVTSPAGDMRAFAQRGDSLRELTAREIFDIRPVAPR